MTTKSAPFYWLECDGCGAKSTEHGDYDAWADRSTAVDEAEDADWYVSDSGDYCEDCAADRRIRTCEGCGTRGPTTTTGDDVALCPACTP